MFELDAKILLTGYLSTSALSWVAALFYWIFCRSNDIWNSKNKMLVGSSTYNFFVLLFSYSLTNCLFAATYDQILETCKCVPFFHTMAYEDYPQICSGPALQCMNVILRDIGSHTNVKIEDAHGNMVERPCLFACK